MYVIWKYELEIKGDVQELSLPVGSRLLSVQVQHGQPCLWVCVDQDGDIDEVRRLMIVGTGYPFPNEQSYNHIGTFQMFNGDIVFHLLEIV